MDQTDRIEKASLLLKALAVGAKEAKCVGCETTELVIEIDEPFDEVFFANYHCEKCEQEGK